MISITIFKDQEQYRGIRCSGHAGFEQAGKDIVCAAVSMLVINTINGIDQFTEDAYALDSKEDDTKTSKKKRFFLGKEESDNLIDYGGRFQGIELTYGCSGLRLNRDL